MKSIFVCFESRLINQVSIKAVITVPYQLGEGDTVSYLIEKHGDVLTSIIG
jgi:hypothetical protein